MNSMYHEKYRIVARRTRILSGRLLDVGARDCVLKQFLLSPDIEYLSADITTGHDYQIDLEEPLAIDDNAFDVVVCLDVLEHLEHPHRALVELIRVARSSVFVSLPNMACFSFRMNFLLRGELSGKYALNEYYQADRHRWLPTYDQSRDFVQKIASQAGCSVRQYDVYESPLNYGKQRFLGLHFLFPPKLRTYTQLFEINK